MYALIILSTMVATSTATQATKEDTNHIFTKILSMEKDNILARAAITKVANSKHDWEKSDKKMRPTWPDLITRTIQRFSTQSKAFRSALKSVLATRLSNLSGWGLVTEGASMKDLLTNLLITSIGLAKEDLDKTPTRSSYDAYRDLVSNLKSTTAQEVLKSEINENEAIATASGERTAAIQKWSYLIVITMFIVLFLVITGFASWFCFVCKRARADDEAQASRAEQRTQRLQERRIAGQVAGQVAQEMQPFVPPPTAPPLPLMARAFNL